MKAVISTLIMKSYVGLVGTRLIRNSSFLTIWSDAIATCSNLFSDYFKLFTKVHDQFSDYHRSQATPAVDLRG